MDTETVHGLDKLKSCRWNAREAAPMDRHYVYLIACKGETKTYVKIG